MKQKQPKPKHVRFNYKKLLFIAGGVLLAVLLVVQIAFDAYAYLTVIRPGDQTPVTNLIIKAVEDLHKPAPVDPTTGKVYLTDARLVLPPPSDPLMKIVYGNTAVDTSPELQVSSESILHSAENKLWTAYPPFYGGKRSAEYVFEQVPNLQACARGVQIFFHPVKVDSPQLQLKHTKVLANGQTLYYYTESTCQANLTPLLEYLKQAESY